MAGWLKKYFPACRVVFLGRTYTKDVIALSEYVDEFLDYSLIEKMSSSEQIEHLKKTKAEVIVHVFPVKEIASLARAAEIPLRIGTTNRFYHWFTCNKRIALSRKNSDLHESQLNLMLLSFLNKSTNVTKEEVMKWYGFTQLPIQSTAVQSLIDKNRFNVILHPKSKGSALEWGLPNFSKLIQILSQEKYKVFISGTEDDGKQLKELLALHPEVTNLCGRFSLKEFISFISNCDGLVAASTGPLHIAAALGKKAVGLYSSRRPIHPGRWMPIGEKAHFLVKDAACEQCKKGKNCDCIMQIEPKEIVALLEQK